MKLSTYLETNFKKEKYGFGNMFSEGHLEAIKEFEKNNEFLILKISKDYFMFNTEKAKFSLKTENGYHYIREFVNDKVITHEIKYYNYRLLYKTIKNILY